MRKTVLVALFTAFIYVLGLIKLDAVSGLIGVPIVLQNLGIFIVGSVLGISGVFSVLLLLFLATIGLPVLAGGRGGFEVFLGPTSGYLFGYVLAALTIGFCTQRFWRSYTFLTAVLINFLGMIVIYVCGISYYALNTGTPLLVSTLGNLIYLPFDVVKIVLASVIALNFKKYYPLLGVSSVIDNTSD